MRLGSQISSQSSSSSAVDMPSGSSAKKSKPRPKSKFFSRKSQPPIHPSAKAHLAPALVISAPASSSASSDASASTLSSATAIKTPQTDDEPSTLNRLPVLLSSSASLDSGSSTGFAFRLLSFFKGGVTKGKQPAPEGKKGGQGRSVGAREQRANSSGAVDGNRSMRRKDLRSEPDETRAQSSSSSLLGISWRPRLSQSSPALSNNSSYSTPAPVSLAQNANTTDLADSEEETEEDEYDDDDLDSEFDYSPISSAPPSATPSASFMLYPPSPTKPQQFAQQQKAPSRSHTHIVQMTIAGLQPTPSPHPLVTPSNNNISQSSLLFPRSANSPCDLSSPLTFLVAFQKNRVIQRLESNKLTAAEELSIMTFATRRIGVGIRGGDNPNNPASRLNYYPSQSRSAVALRNAFPDAEDSMRRVDILPVPTARGNGSRPMAYSRGVGKWLQRPSFASRAVEWSEHEGLGYRWVVVSPTSCTRQDLVSAAPLEFSKGLLALAGAARPNSSLDVKRSPSSNLLLPQLLIPPAPSPSSSPSPSAGTSTAPTTPKSGRASLPLVPSRSKLSDMMDEDDIPLGMARPSRPDETPRALTEDQARRKALEREKERLRREKEKAAEKEAKEKKMYAEQITAARLRRESLKAGPRHSIAASSDLVAVAERDTRQQQDNERAQTKGHVSSKSITDASSIRSGRSRRDSRPSSIFYFGQPFVPGSSLPSPGMHGIIANAPVFYPVDPNTGLVFPPVPAPFYAYAPSAGTSIRDNSPNPSLTRLSSGPSESGASRRLSMAYSEQSQPADNASDSRSLRSAPRSPSSGARYISAPPVPPLPAGLATATSPTSQMHRPTPWTGHRRSGSGDSRRSERLSDLSHPRGPSSSSRSLRAHPSNSASRPRTIIS